MQIREVEDVLSPFGLGSPDLEMLRPNEARYQCLLLQPSGPIVASSQRIGSYDMGTSEKKAVQFLRLAANNGAHLAVTPEYFFPWSALRALLLDGTAPNAGALWVLGCESIRQEELAAFKVAVAQVCEVIHEPCEPLPQDRPLLDPVVLLFVAPRAEGGTRAVALVQFKTYPSRDNLFLEEGLLKRGSVVYRFRGANGILSAAAVICSDAFALTEDLVSQLIDRSTLIHIQLNPDPRNSTYRQYRKTAFETDPRTSDCHIVCLNWAGSVVQYDENGSTEDWPTVAGSTWYCPETGCTHDDTIVLSNHKLGLYYAYMQERRHVLLFHYDEAVFELQVPKVVTVGKAVMANRNGPSATQRYLWNAATSQWKPADDAADSGFNALLDANAEAKAALAHAAKTTSVLDLERLLALSVGSISGTDTWFAAKEIDSCRIAPDEVVHRITVAQDKTAAAVDFRHGRLEVAANIRLLLDNVSSWPPQVHGITKAASYDWNVGSRHFNVRSVDGKPALIAFLGDSPSERVLENVPSMLINLLRRAGGVNQTRLCILYRRFGELKFAALPGFTRFDDAIGDETDIMSVQSD